MKKVKLVLILISFIGVFYLINHPIGTYEFNYFGKIGIYGAWRYCDIVEDKGEPISIDKVNARYYVNYDGLILTYDNIESGIMQSASITGEQYRFGLLGIGVGTPREKIESIYRHVKKILGLRENEFGVIDGDAWVSFIFDENDCVSKIILTDGL